MTLSTRVAIAAITCLGCIFPVIAAAEQHLHKGHQKAGPDSAGSPSSFSRLEQNGECTTPPDETPE